MCLVVDYVTLFYSENYSFITYILYVWYYFCLDTFNLWLID